MTQYKFVTKEDLEETNQDYLDQGFGANKEAGLFFDMVRYAERLLAERDAAIEVAKKKAETVAVFASPLGGYFPCWTDQSLRDGVMAEAARILGEKSSSEIANNSSQNANDPL